MDDDRGSGSDSSYSTHGTKNKAQCISNVSNWSKSKTNHLFDKPDAFVPESVKTQMADASPKLVALFDKIRVLDAADMSKHGHLFKHMIFSGNQVSNHGLKMVASAFLAQGFELAFDAAKETGALRHKPMEHLEKNGKNMLSLLMSKPLYGKPMTSYFKKHTLQLFNARPQNVHGDIVRFICLDGGFREGIDLFDIKYIHLLEPTPIKADERQAIGRGTRFCGQKGITFDPKRGWPLYVFRYEVSIPPAKRANFQGAETFMELQLKYSDIDIREVTFAAELEEVVIEGAVDKELTKPVHEFTVPPDSTVGGGSKDIVYLSDPKLHLDVYDGDRSSASASVMLQLGQRTAAKEKEPAKSASTSSSPAPHPPRRIMGHKRMQEFVSKYFSRFQYPPVKLENGCVGGGGSESYENAKSSTTSLGGAASVIASFTPTQDFVRHFFQPSSAYKGMLMYHSVGTGKSCTGIATASTSFEKEGYTILWVTRHTLKADIAKNQFGIVCNVAMQERLRKGLAVAKSNLSKAWLNPISYKQFSNMLLKKNKVYFDMVARNGVDDPLRKTLIVIDEAHKLYAPDTPKAEQPDTDILEKMLHKSYEESGADSARVILMTATPYTRSAMEMIHLLNLIRPKKDTFPVGDELYSRYLNAAGRFTARGKAAFMDEISGYISYLNRSSDARNFAYPIIKDVIVEMSSTPANPDGKQNKYMKKIKDLKAEKPNAREEDKTLQDECIGKAQSNVDADAAGLDERKHAATARKDAALDRCAELPKGRKTGCKTEAQAQYNEAMDSIKAEKAAGKETLKHQKKECKEIKQNTEALLEKIREAQEEYDVVKKEKTLLKEEIAIRKRELLTVSNEYKRLSEAKRHEVNALKNIASTTERKRQRKVIQEKYANMPSLVARVNQIRQQLQNAAMRMNVVNEKIGIRLAEDMSQETALLSRCAAHRRAPSPSPRHSPSPPHTSPPRRSPSPPRRRAQTTKKSPSYVGPSVADFQAEFQSAFAMSGENGAKKAYRKFTLQYHPDKHPSNIKKHEAIFKVLQQAWQAFKLRRNIAGGHSDDDGDDGSVFHL